MEAELDAHALVEVARVQAVWSNSLQTEVVLAVQVPTESKVDPQAVRVEVALVLAVQADHSVWLGVGAGLVLWFGTCPQRASPLSSH